jgi:hypothetical protein
MCGGHGMGAGRLLSMLFEKARGLVFLCNM